MRRGARSFVPTLVLSAALGAGVVASPTYYHLFGQAAGPLSPPDLLWLKVIVIAANF